MATHAYSENRLFSTHSGDVTASGKCRDPVFKPKEVRTLLAKLLKAPGGIKDAKVTDVLLQSMNAGRTTPLGKRQLQNKVHILKAGYRNDSGPFAPDHSDPALASIKREYLIQAMVQNSASFGGNSR